TARVENVGFHDIDGDPLNDWTQQRVGDELHLLAPAGNPLDWNTIYNVWFDSDAAPVLGEVSIDQARLGPGALTVNVPARVPGHLGVEYLGAGCGAPAPKVFANGLPDSPNAAFAMEFEAAPVTALLAVYSFGGGATD